MGDPFDLCHAGPDDEPEWRLLRGFGNRPERHLGADFGDGRSNDPVRAAAHGVVVLARERPDPGFGIVVVLAHRLREGGLAYSVYSHLARGSVCVHEGECVMAGDVIAGVGCTGNATTDHLHFEVRVPVDPQSRWERARAVDPVRFVSRRLPRCVTNSRPLAPALDWADRAGLLPPGAPPEAPLTRGAWELMLARAARVPVIELPRGAAAVRDWLLDQGVLPERDPAACHGGPSWQELERDLGRLAAIGTRLPPAPEGPDGPAPSADGPVESGGPTLADACQRLATLAAPHGPSRHR